MDKISNYHSHLYLCRHATGTIDEYCNKAIEKGIQILGISDHVPYTDELSIMLNSRRMSVDEFNNVYLPDMAKAKEVYKEKLTLLVAFEIEYYDNYQAKLLELAKKVDYCVLGQHEIYENGTYKSVYDRTFNAHDLIVYKDNVIKALSTGIFKVLAHPEIFNYRYNNFDETANKISKEIIEACDKYHVYMEINSNGIRASKIKGYNYLDESVWCYPNPKFWDIVAKYQKKHPSLKVIINDDCHFVDALNDEFSQMAMDFAKARGIIVSPKIEF